MKISFFTIVVFCFCLLITGCSTTQTTTLIVKDDEKLISMSQLMWRHLRVFESFKIKESAPAASHVLILTGDKSTIEEFTKYLVREGYEVSIKVSE